MTLTAGVGEDDDNSFMSNYHDVDDSYNIMIKNNHDFNINYDTIIMINNTSVTQINYNDVYLSQRVIKNRKNRKNILKVGNNIISVIIKNKKTNEIVENVKSHIVFTKPSSHDSDFIIDLKDNEKNSFEIKQKTYWNIMGKININNHEGNFFIKTNSN